MGIMDVFGGKKRQTAVTQAIHARRSIRRFEPTPLPKEDIVTILQAGMQAPSAKNRQPWRFVVVQGDGKAGMLDAMERGFRREAADPKLPGSAGYLPGARNTAAIMAEAPVTIFVLNPLNTLAPFPQNWEQRFYELANVQSVGACIQNMLLAAGELGYGSLWICDTDFAYEELAHWLDTEDQILAAVSLGVPAQSPYPRPRKAVEELVQWK